MFVERRSNRSRRQDLATRYYLINVTRRHRPRAVVLTDMNGEVVAGVEGKPFMEAASSPPGPPIAPAGLSPASPSTTSVGSRPRAVLDGSTV